MGQNSDKSWAPDEGSFRSAPQQKDHNDDYQYPAKSPAIIDGTERPNRNPRRTLHPMEKPRRPAFLLTLLRLFCVLFSFPSGRVGLGGLCRNRCRLPQERPSGIISGALSAALHTFASLAARVVATDWPTLLSGSRVRLDLIGIFFSHGALRLFPPQSTVSEETGSFVFLVVRLRTVM
jgi:hypothetical protein